jgi:hypothetical protein
MRRRIIAGLLITAGLATAGVAYAEGQPADPSVASNQDSAAKAGAAEARAAKAGGRKAGLLKGAIHGDLLIRAEDGSTRTVTFDRGKVTALSGGSITIVRPDGISVSKALTDQTVFNGTPRDQLQEGAAVVVVSSGDIGERVLSKGARVEQRKERVEQRKERLEQRKERLEQRKERRDGRAGEAPSTEPSSIVDDGLETIVS